MLKRGLGESQMQVMIQKKRLETQEAKSLAKLKILEEKIHFLMSQRALEEAKLGTITLEITKMKYL